jgi:hypothetical protein
MHGYQGREPTPSSTKVVRGRHDGIDAPSAAVYLFYTLRRCDPAQARRQYPRSHSHGAYSAAMAGRARRSVYSSARA